ncbi:MAG: N-carbamoylputrescine amidase [Pseudomonadota bacterium]
MTLTVAVSQMSCTWDRDANADKAEALIRKAADRGARLVLIQELFETPYFCTQQDGAHRNLAAPFAENPLIARFAALTQELGVVLPISFFERDGNTFYNSIAIADADGTVLGCYRKSHIPDGPGYQEKFYFTPGNTGFQVWQTSVGCIGVGICWDQWFPEAARTMALMGAEILLYPTAIGSEPPDPTAFTRPHWQRVMQGHAGANLVPLMASNRIGTELWPEGDMTFYGGSFIAGAEGQMLAEMDREEGIALAELDMDMIRQQRWDWGIFRDRRPDLYGRVSGQ